MVQKQGNNSQERNLILILHNLSKKHVTNSQILALNFNILHIFAQIFIIVNLTRLGFWQLIRQNKEFEAVLLNISLNNQLQKVCTSNENNNKLQPQSQISLLTNDNSKVK